MDFLDPVGTNIKTQSCKTDNLNKWEPSAHRVENNNVDKDSRKHEIADTYYTIRVLMGI